MKLPLAYYGDSILRQKTRPIEKIDDEIKQLVADMEETMEANNGCGLAAPQVHRSIALFITRIPRYTEDEQPLPGELRVFINPKIISHSPENWSCEEGCLSIPGLNETVERPVRVTFEATDLDGRVFTEEFTEFEAHVMMHENDHILGVLYVDRLPPKVKKRIAPLLKEIKKKYGAK